LALVELVEYNQQQIPLMVQILCLVQLLQMVADTELALMELQALVVLVVEVATHLAGHLEL
jgi:hypothetical protein